VARGALAGEEVGEIGSADAAARHASITTMRIDANRAEKRIR
jgi:hypothetical protein